MAQTTTPPGDPAASRGTVNYIGRMAEMPYMYYRDPEPGQPYTNIIDEPHEVDIADLRSAPDSMTLARDMLQFVRFDHAFDRFDDDAAVRAKYFPVVRDMFRELLGIDRVVVFDYAVRRPDHGPKRPQGIPVAGPQRRPIMRVHGDFIKESIRDLVTYMSDLCGPGALDGRYRAFNFWRPLRGPLTDRPLAFCHPSTVSQADIVPMKQFNTPKDNHIFALRHNPDHRWFYFSRMMENEGVVFSSYDSNYPESRGVVAHSAFVHPAHTVADLPRDSIEVRVLVFGE